MASEDEKKAAGSDEERPEQERSEAPEAAEAEATEAEGSDEKAVTASEEAEEGSREEDEAEASADDDSEAEQAVGADEEADEEEAAAASDDEERPVTSSAAAAAGAATAAAAGKKGKGKGAKGGMTPGQRLAAAKAAKAARKAAKRGREGERREERVLKQADAAADWVERNRRNLWIGAMAIVVAIVGVVVWTQHRASQAEQATELLWDAIETANAEIRPEGAVSADDETPTFQSIEARAERALERFDKVLEEYPASEAAVWAKLGKGNALFDLGRHEEAREVFLEALGEAGDDPVVAWRSLEGIGFTYEANEEWDQAIEQFEELKGLGEASWESIAEYHLGRMYLAKGETNRAKETFAALLERLRAPGEEDEETGPDLSYTETQTELRLAELDPSAVPSAPGGFGGMGGGVQMPSAGGGQPGKQQLSQEQLQRLIEQFQKKQQAAGQGGPPGTGAPSPGDVVPVPTPAEGAPAEGAPEAPVAPRPAPGAAPAPEPAPPAPAPPAPAPAPEGAGGEAPAPAAQGAAAEGEGSAP